MNPFRCINFQALHFFDNREVRAVGEEVHHKWWFSICDGTVFGNYTPKDGANAGKSVLIGVR